MIMTISYLFYFNQPYEDLNSSKISILFLGDFMIGDSYEGPSSKPFESIKSIFENKSDIIINLETAVTDRNDTPYLDKSYIYKINNSVLLELKKWNVTMVNLANNHALDYGDKGFEDTIFYLSKMNLSYFGAGQNITQARSGIISDYSHNTKIGFLGYFEYRSLYDLEYHFYAKNDKPGVAPLNNENLKNDIIQMKKKSDIVIVSLHIGNNYNTNISKSHQNFCRYAIDAGADAVVCHSAHIVLPIEIYKGKPIFYSIGNSIFTTPGRFRYVDEIYHVGLAVNLIIQNKKIISIEITPFKTNNKVTNYHPSFLNKDETRLLFDTILADTINVNIYDSSVVIDMFTRS
jgi:poly-gamma-glutamate synthesis protein (capsule biosynthesis protein)